MLINFPNQLTSEEEQLLKKIAKMKKKKKLYLEKKTQIKESQTEASQVASAQSSTSTLAAVSALKRFSTKQANSGSGASQLDAKEAAKKLIQSGVIKLETENKEKGFKRSCSRKDDGKKAASLVLNQEPIDTNSPSKQITYSSMQSPNSVTSPPIGANSTFFNQNKFSYSDKSYQQQQTYNQRNFQKNPTFRYNNNNNNNINNQSPNAGDNSSNNFRFQNQRQNQQQNGVSLYVKANNVNEELLRSIFAANVSQAKLLSIDVKSNFAFISVDTKESAELAIQELNGKTFQENLFSVSLARPRKTFFRNNSYNNERNFGGGGSSGGLGGGDANINNPTLNK